MHHGDDGAMNLQAADRARDDRGRMYPESEAAKRRHVVEWLKSLFPDLNMAVEASEGELRALLLDGTVLCRILNRLNAGSLERLDNLKRFLSAIEEMGLPKFNVFELEQGSISAVVECLLSLRNHLNSDLGKERIRDATKSGSQSRKKWNLLESDRSEVMDVSQGNQTQDRQNLVALGGERRRSTSESKLQRVLLSPVISEPPTSLLHHAGHNFHEVFQLKQGRYSDLPAAKISEMLKSNSLDNAPTQSLLSVVNGILDESIERKNGEIPHRVACLLRKVVQEIERRISTQAEHLRNQNNLIKAREEKYQSRIRVLETLATGASDETQIVMNQLHTTKAEKNKIEGKKKLGEQDVDRLTKEKENSDHVISDLKQELEMTNKTHEHRCQQLEMESKETKARSEERIKEAEFLLAETRKKTKELETFSESKFQSWNKKEHIFQNFIGFQRRLVEDLRMASESIKQEVINIQKSWWEEINSLGTKLKVLIDAAENFHTVLAENRRLYNEVQELKGNIRVYGRIRPFLHGESKKLTTVDYIGENGELLVVNPSKPGKDGHRMFKFNKVFGPTASQEEVFLDIQPLIRSVLDGYNVCIFAYGQTGSGKTYTMSGPNSPTKENCGVNYRALNDLFDISQNRRSTVVYEVGIQMVEIYNEQVRDLLSNDGSQKRLGIWSSSQPNGLVVPDASLHPVQSTSDVLQLMQFGQTNRAVGSTALNERSSRSHSVLTVHVRGMDLKNGSTSRGSLHLIDLAGSERVDRSEVTGDRLKEAQHINKSLSALGDVIFALAQKSSHIPYRNSRLTQVLQSSLGGQAKTLMFVQINPNVDSYSETLSTLKFAERVSGVELGAARSNKEGKDVKDLMEQVASLKDTIARKDAEIEELQQLKDLGTQSPNGNSERRGSRSFKHSSSSPRLSSLDGTALSGQRLSGGRVVKSTEKAASDPENCSEFSDNQSETGPQHRQETSHQPNLNGEGRGQSYPAHVELLGIGDTDSEERLSDISDGGLSIGAETGGSISSAAEFSLLPEVGKPSETKTEKTPVAPSRLAKLPSQKTEQATAARLKLKDSLKTPSLRKSTITQTTASSSAKVQKSWQ